MRNRHSLLWLQVSSTSEPHSTKYGFPVCVIEGRDVRSVKTKVMKPVFEQVELILKKKIHLPDNKLMEVQKGNEAPVGFRHTVPTAFRYFYFERQGQVQHVCPKRFASASEMNDHMARHLLPNSIICMKCGTIFHTGESLSINEDLFMQHLELKHPVFINRAEPFDPVPIQDEFSPEFDRFKVHRNIITEIRTQTLKNQAEKEYLNAFKKECVRDIKHQSHKFLF